MANSFEFDAIDLAGASYGVTAMREFQMPFMAEPDVFTRNIPQSHGGFSGGGRRKQLVIPVPAMIQGSSMANLLTKVDNLNFLMDPLNGDKSIKFDWMTGRFWKGRLRNEIKPQILGVANAQVLFEFLCADPLAFDSTEVDRTETVNADPFAFTEPAGSGTTVGGNAVAKPVWVLQNTEGSGTLTSIKLTNNTTGAAIEIDYPLPDTEWLRIDSGLEMIESSSDESAWTNRNQYRSNTNKTYPTLNPRVQNSFTLTGCTSGALDITYRARYLG